MRLLVVRHGVTDWNIQGRLQGRTDIDLNAEGLRQARALAARLKAEPLDRLFSSPMLRASRTAQAVAEAKGLAVETDAVLNEADMGLWEGLTWEEIAARHPEQLKERSRIGLSYKGHGGESVLEVSVRIGRFWERLRREAPGLTVCAVTHASTSTSASFDKSNVRFTLATASPWLPSMVVTVSGPRTEATRPV